MIVATKVIRQKNVLLGEKKKVSNKSSKNKTCWQKKELRLIIVDVS